MPRTGAAHPEDSVTPTTRPQLPRGLARAGVGTAVAGLVLAGCGGAASSSGSSAGAGASSTGASSASSTPNPSASPSSCDVAHQITVTGSKVSPPPSTVDVKAGCEVRLTVTADRTSQVHVHVVNLEKPITAGQPVTIDFTPTQQGVYEVELHDPDLLLVKLAVR
jgi:plastocyanin